MGNIVPKTFAPIVWNPQSAREQVNELCQQVQSKVESAVQWYLEKKRAPQRMSQALRAVAILLIVTGGLCPILNTSPIIAKTIPLAFAELGYILLALGGAALIIDTYSGFSNAWMRYIDAHLKLDALLHRFQLDWAVACLQYDLDPNAKSDPARLLALIEKLRAFATEANELVQTETQTWMAEFKSQLAMLRKATEREKAAEKEKAAGPEQAADPEKAAAAAAQAAEATGEVNVTVDNFDSVTEPIVLYVDGSPAYQLSAKTGRLKVRAGSRELAAYTYVNGSRKTVGTKANVVSGAATDVLLTIPLD